MTQRGQIIAGYLLGETLGMGTYGKVKLGKGKRASSSESDENEYVAVKILDRRQFEEVAVKKEIAVHKRCNEHPNVVRYVDFKVTPNHSYIVLELAEGGELYHRIVPDSGVAPDVAHFLFKQLLRAVAYFQAKGVAHRDIKPENILLDKFGNVKVTDFGLATVFRYRGTTRKLNKKCGTPPYVAPEVYAGLDYDGTMVDLWSCGVVLVALTAGWLPWRVPTPRDPDYELWIDGNHDECAWVERSRRLHQAYPVLLGMLTPTLKSRWDIRTIEESEWYKQETELTALEGPDGLISVETDALRVQEEPLLELSESAARDHVRDDSCTRPSKRSRVDTLEQSQCGSEPWSPNPVASAPSTTSPRIKRESCFTSRLNFEETIDHLEDVFEELFVSTTATASDPPGGAAPPTATRKKGQNLWVTTRKSGVATIVVTVTDPEGEPLEFSVRIRPKGAGKQLVDFMHIKGDSMDFKRKYAAVCEVLFPLESFNACTETQYTGTIM